MIGQEGDTTSIWSRPDCVVIGRHLVDGSYVFYRVDDPSKQLKLTRLELLKVASLFQLIAANA